MRAIKINPWAQTVTEINLTPDSTGSLYEAIRSELFGNDLDGRLLQAVRLGGPFLAYIDEEGLLINWDEQAFFQLIAKEGDNLTIAGVALLLNDDGQGGERACTLPLDMVARTVRWIDRKDVRVPAPTLTTFGDDGTETTEPLDGHSTEWTYDNQPG